MRYSQLIDLHLSQCEIFLKKALNNCYSDNDKKAYQEKLFELFEKIKTDLPATLDESNVFEIQEQLNFIAKSLEFLMDSTLNTIPFEVVSCLNLAMKDWIDDDDFIIVTSLNNDIEYYSFDGKLALDDLLYSSILASYSIPFKKRLVQINLPFILSKDYFSSVILYHELGHFIDLHAVITEKMANELIKCPPGEWSTILEFFPYKQDPVNLETLISHLGEYFCDLFAAQYIGNTSTYYLKYLESKKTDIHNTSHPSSNNRMKVVEDFLGKKPNVIVDKIKHYTKLITKRELKKRFKIVNSDDFYQFIPLEISNSAELHGVFPYAWKIWLAGAEKLKENAELQGDLPSKLIYKALNNLIEKSIGNYFVLKDWERAKLA
jgi:hypothetical protein